ncbi:uncharacterized protein LOC131670857 [Phymastichus coffea]|uniref:uncharacterized protein LOC131670857 n=1 Tax=Phymastichus coffea TaxID=108790 RepID=UPI00273AEFD2|nr:uncharacterized protein LOC131670857 [Phymastichus coffea]
MKYQIYVIILLVTFDLTGGVINLDDEEFFGEMADRYNWPNHPCRRICSYNDVPRHCFYTLVIEEFSSMSKACHNCPFNVTDCFRPHCMPTDGKQKPLYVVNRQLPGPLIEVCINDIIVVDVRNRMLSESTVIHWHGFKQRGTPYMDGVAYVNQCPILPGTDFRYTFRASDPGTFFYHSHIGYQRADGLFGPIVVNKMINEDRMANLYDNDDLYIMIHDWSHKTGDVGAVEQFYVTASVAPTTMLINGLGRFQQFQSADGKMFYSPVAVFNVSQGVRYRIRLINSGAEDCPMKMSVDSHSLLVISMDSNDIEPVEVDAITTWSGERVDFILNANQRPDNYWIRVSGYGVCSNTSAHQVAILRYYGAPFEDPMGVVGYDLPQNNKERILNPYNVGVEVKSKENVYLPDLKSMDPNDHSLRKYVDQQIYIKLDFYNIDNYDFARKDLYGFNQVPYSRWMGTFQLNHISLKLPPVPLMSQWNMLEPNDFCNAENPPKRVDCMDETLQCACTHVISLRLNSVVELIFVNGDSQGNEFIAAHPMHLHGHFFRVVAIENLEGNVTVEQVKQLDREGKIKRILDRAPIKDTIKAPSGGYTVVRLFADNPGYWLFHCHFEQHSNIGMALIFKVGEHEEFPKVPYKFPRCGNYLPRAM